MRIDFHFSTVYALARAAGFNPDDASIIAYSSQYTDDEAAEDIITFENGGSFKPFITAHQIFNLHTVTEDICKRVWIPFHFLPDGEGIGNERLLTKPNCNVAKAIINDFLNFELKPYSLHLLGIILHAYADTWSHQNFMGIWDKWNRVNELRVNGEDSLEFHVYKVRPSLGHAQADSKPDEPCIEWEYIDNIGKANKNINYELALDAANNCYIFLSDFLKVFPSFINSQIISWAIIREKIESLFRYEDDLQGCINAWAEAISNNQIGFNSEGKDIKLIYNPGEFFSTAVETGQKMNPESGQFVECYTKKDNFQERDMKYFNDAASFYWEELFMPNVRKIGLDMEIDDPYLFPVKD